MDGEVHRFSPLTGRKHAAKNFKYALVERSNTSVDSTTNPILWAFLPDNTTIVPSNVEQRFQVNLMLPTLIHQSSMPSRNDKAL